ncbi:fungal hydrophobin-domain-containing protein [Rhodocollybia butyracea]|uniref:Hydrophobin n=1 Tax=Rhodocollybia butyracea TaxID=206335 RepID=A0A9P5TZU7_9AGAR|nr:fungal hydrophobin-domain-containing protein [Rhodocollybia butyracea]
MFSRISTIAFFALFAFTLLATASPGYVKRWATTTPPVTTTVTVTAPATTSTVTAGQCSTGPVQCCTSTETAGSAAGAAVLGLLGIVVQDATVLLGLGCSGINVAGGGTCNSQAVCCQDNAVGGLISIGCIPVTI